MAISRAINLSQPDGATITISELDDATVTHKVDVQERMDDSILDTSGGVTWITSTTPKHLKKGLARLHRTTAATKPAAAAHSAERSALTSDQIWIRDVTDSPVASEASFQYYDGAAWQDIKVGANNVMDSSVLPGIQTTTDGTSHIVNSATWTNVDSVAGTLPQMTITPISTSSIFLVWATGQIQAGVGSQMGVRLYNVEDTTALCGTFMQQHNDGGLATVVVPFHIQAYVTSLAAARTVRLEFVRTAGINGNLFGGTVIDGFTFATRLGAIQFK